MERSGLMGSLRLHERTLLVQRLGAQMERRFWESPELGELTSLEAAKIVNGWVNRLVTLGLRTERHPDDPDKKADEA